MSLAAFCFEFCIVFEYFKFIGQRQIWTKVCSRRASFIRATYLLFLFMSQFLLSGYLDYQCLAISSKGHLLPSFERSQRLGVSNQNFHLLVLRDLRSFMSRAISKVKLQVLWRNSLSLWKITGFMSSVIVWCIHNVAKIKAYLLC